MDSSDGRRQLPRLRHHAARRRPAGGPEPHGRRQAAIARHLDEPRRRLHRGRVARAPTPRTPSSSGARRPSSTCKHAQLAAFGATRRPGVQAADDPQVAALRESGAPVVTLVAKSHDRHVELALRTTLEENLAMIRDTVAHLRAEGQRVFLDAEHFFDGYRSDPAYALEVVRAAAEAGRRRGRAVRHQRRHAARRARATWSPPCARHRRPARHPLPRRHRLRGRQHAAPRSRPGVTHVQGRANGYGERAGNANLFTRRRPTSSSSMGCAVLPDGAGRDDPDRARDQPRSPTSPRTATSPTWGCRAFAHKAGLHASARQGRPDLYQHIDPAAVGNDMRMLVSDMAGRASVELKGSELGYDLSGDEAASAGWWTGSRSWRPGLHVRGGRRLVRAAAARGAGRRAGSGTSRSSPGGSSSSAARTASWSARPR